MSPSKLVGRPFDLVHRSPPETPMIRGVGLRNVGRDLRQIASTGLRSLVLIAMAMLLILVLIPAAFVAAGT
jgi:hypothetical protein